ncbi:Hypothetical_protein [Hexamita inflata]|uniref:Hypothetical_protein n=1 Tax=Hexamita inflata TaxID=28002 RepID=A0AA86QA06_9EUKA|nr:Hypothetical protein HINF_LOCUS39158 [Hexamita inflata]
MSISEDELYFELEDVSNTLKCTPIIQFFQYLSIADFVIPGSDKLSATQQKIVKLCFGKGIKNNIDFDKSIQCLVDTLNNYIDNKIEQILQAFNITDKPTSALEYLSLTEKIKFDLVIASYYQYLSGDYMLTANTDQNVDQDYVCDAILARLHIKFDPLDSSQSFCMYMLPLLSLIKKLNYKKSALYETSTDFIPLLEIEYLLYEVVNEGSEESFRDNFLTVLDFIIMTNHAVVDSSKVFSGILSIQILANFLNQNDFHSILSKYLKEKPALFDSEALLIANGMLGHFRYDEDWIQLVDNLPIKPNTKYSVDAPFQTQFQKLIQLQLNQQKTGVSIKKQIQTLKQQQEWQIQKKAKSLQKSDLIKEIKFVTESTKTQENEPTENCIVTQNNEQIVQKEDEIDEQKLNEQIYNNNLQQLEEDLNNKVIQQPVIETTSVISNEVIIEQIDEKPVITEPVIEHVEQQPEIIIPVIEQNIINNIQTEPQQQNNSNKPLTDVQIQSTQDLKLKQQQTVQSIKSKERMQIKVRKFVTLK